MDENDVARRCAALVCPYCARGCPFTRLKYGPLYHLDQDDLKECRALPILTAFELCGDYGLYSPQNSK